MIFIIIMIRYTDVIIGAANRLQEADVLNPDTDAWELFEFAFHMDKKEYLLHMSEEVKDEEGMQRYKEVIDLRCRRIPLQHITGEQGFMGLTFHVNQNVLCPRQDTESLVEVALQRIVPGMRILDMCTGSGCILISLLALARGITGVGVDISEDALVVARENAWTNRVEADFYHGDLFAPIRGMKFDMIVCNPPYIPTKVIEGLMPEVRDHEPHQALDGDIDGLAFYRRITAQAKDCLNPGGFLIFEIGIGQRDEVASLLFTNGFLDIVCYRDYAGNERVILGKS